jgi:hypothetical protein
MAVARKMGYNGDMPLPALKDLTIGDEFSEPLDLPALSADRQSSIYSFAKSVTKLEGDLQQRITDTILRREAFANQLADFIKQSPDSVPHVLEHLDDIAELLSKSIDSHKAKLDNFRTETDKKIAASATVDRNGAKFLRKLQKRILKAFISYINNLVEYYYFMLSLRAEYDPDSRGGPSLSTAEEIDDYFRKMIDA